MKMTLSELNAQNEAQEANQDVVNDEVEMDTEVDSEVEEVNEDHNDDAELEDEAEEVESSDDEEDDSETEEWMKGSDDKTIPLSEHIDIRQSLKESLRNQRNEKTELEKKVEQLEAQLKSNVQAPSTTTEEVKAPDVSAFTNEYDEVDWVKFNQANNKYIQDMMNLKINGISQEQQQKAQLEQKQAESQKVIDSHYGRAEKLVQNGVLKAEDYGEADLNIVQRFDQLAVGQGRYLADELISHLSSVSDEPEKVWYKLGRDSHLLDEVIQAYQADPSGVQGVAKLARISQKFSKPITRKSSAPKPTKQLKGSQSEKADSARLLRKYREASKKGDISTSFKTKREAKKAGVDTSNW